MSVPMAQKKHLNYNKSNIFGKNKRDAALYFVTYIILPISTILFMIIKKTNDNLFAFAMCYFTVFINTFTCFYDITNRWANKKSFKNLKLFIMAIPVIIIGSYSFIEFIGTLMLEKIIFVADWLCLLYGFTVLIALIDVVKCFFRDVALSRNV